MAISPSRSSRCCSKNVLRAAAVDDDAPAGRDPIMADAARECDMVCEWASAEGGGG